MESRYKRIISLIVEDLKELEELNEDMVQEYFKDLHLQVEEVLDI